jgi:membrane fusion protein, heavy metal efflux system
MMKNTMIGQWIKALAVTLVWIIQSQSAYAESDHDGARNDGVMHGEESEQGGDHEEEGHIGLTVAQIAHADIGLAQVAPASIRETLPLYGLVVPNAERVQSVGARFDGVIRGVTKTMGDSVNQGEELAKVESNESLKTYSIVSSLSGVVTERDANVGEQTAGKTLFVVSDFSTVWAELSLFPSDVAKAHVGQQARIECSEANLVTEGKVIYVAPFGSSANQAITVRVLLDNSEHRLVPGHFITAELTLAETVVPLAVRNEAVQTLEQRSVVFVKGNEGFEPRPVRLGRTDGEVSELLAGLEAGETYVTTNSFILKSELGKEGAEHGH